MPTKQLECPYPNDPWVSNAETQEGAAIRFIEHVLLAHPGLPGGIPQPVQAAVDYLKGRHK